MYSDGVNKQTNKQKKKKRKKDSGYVLKAETRLDRSDVKGEGSK